MKADLSNGESLIIFIHEHWIKYVRIIFTYALLTVISIFFFVIATSSAITNIWLSYAIFMGATWLFLLTHHWFFMAAISQSENHIIVTSGRVVWIRNRIFFDDEMLEFSFDKMKTVEAVKDSFLQYIFRYGTLKFESGEHIPFVPHPNHVVKKISQAMGMR